MNEMIERAAKAIYDSYAERLTIASPSYEEFKILHPVNFYKDLAKAAIQAMREPSVSMINAAIRYGVDFDMGINYSVYVEMYQKMIDKALADV